MNKHVRIFILLFILIIICASYSFASKTATVKWKYVNLRETPKKDAPVVTTLAKDISVTIIDESDEWYRIETEEEITGWIVKISLTEPVAANKAEPSENAEKIVPIPEIAKMEETVKAEPVKAEPVKTEPVVEAKTKAPDKDDGTLLSYSEKAEKQETSYAEDEVLSPISNDADTYLSPKTGGAMPSAPSMTGAFVRMLSALFIILAVILALYYVVRKYFSKSLFAFEGGSAITVLSSKYIGQKNIVYIIDVLEKIIVVAVTGSDIKTLTEISDPESMQRMRSQIASLKESEKPFQRFFFDKVKEMSGGKTVQKPESFDIIDELNKKLQKKVDDIKGDDKY